MGVQTKLTVSVLFAAGCSIYGCGRSPHPPVAVSAEVGKAKLTAPEEPKAPVAASTVANPPTPPKAPRAALLDPSLLHVLEESGFQLGQLVLGKAWSTSSALSTTGALDRTPSFRSLFDVLRADLRETKRKHPLSRVTSRDGYRLFDERWLSSEEMRFELTGIFNRLDRRVLYPEGCGEVRFVYRLRYETEHEGETIEGRLPVNLNVVYQVNDDDCAGFAKNWMGPIDLSAEEEVEWWERGPLSPESRRSWSLRSVEVNLQSFRIQSRAHTTLGGHVEYLMRVFIPDKTEDLRFVPGPMHNMPDVEGLSANKPLRDELLALLTKPESLERIDDGTFVVPEKFLAKRATTVSPRALARPANRPFSALFEASDFETLELEKTRSVRSPKALLRRLDGDSCTGCHQSRGTIAGAHHLGKDDAEAPVFVSLFSASSPHLIHDLERRENYIKELAQGGVPDEYRPSAETQGSRGEFGAVCGLGDPGFEDLKCAEGLECVELEDKDLGLCLTDGVGNACEYGEMAPGRGAHRDLVRLTRRSCEEGMRCDLNRDGFAQGACGTSCRDGSPDVVCGTFTAADEFQNCLRHQKTATECAEKWVFKTGLRQCDEESPCRQDYVCMRTEQKDVGACVPPYFVYPLRLDGYPILN